MTHYRLDTTARACRWMGGNFSDFADMPFAYLIKQFGKMLRVGDEDETYTWVMVGEWLVWADLFGYTVMTDRTFRKYFKEM